jgi:hypothetical protein
MVACCCAVQIQLLCLPCLPVASRALCCLPHHVGPFVCEQLSICQQGISSQTCTAPHAWAWWAAVVRYRSNYCVCVMLAESHQCTVQPAASHQAVCVRSCSICQLGISPQVCTAPHAWAWRAWWAAVVAEEPLHCDCFTDQQLAMHSAGCCMMTGNVEVLPCLNMLRTACYVWIVTA